MKTTVTNLFDPAVAEEVKRRILSLRPESEREWGEMSVAPVLAHCTAGFAMATGAINAKRAPFPFFILGRVIKPLVVGDEKPMRRNSPSVPELLEADPKQCDFERERGLLVEAVDEFVAGGAAACSKYPHPFLGTLKPQQWAVLMYKHVDHHLRQFGA